MERCKEISAAVEEQDFDRALDEIELIGNSRPLTTGEMVKKGRWILLSEGRPGRRPPDARALFESALESDPDFVPALIELGWYWYTVEDNAVAARPYFEHALTIVRQQVRDIAEGWVNSVAEMEGRTAAEHALASLARSLLDEQLIRDELMPSISDE